MLVRRKADVSGVSVGHWRGGADPGLRADRPEWPAAGATAPWTCRFSDVSAEEFEHGRAELDALGQWWTERGELTRNEATTRFHLIDALLTNVLHWPKETIRLEDSLDRTYADYALGSPATRLIVEAKREGVYFELPVGVGSGLMQLKTVMDADPAVDAAVRQAMGYAHSRGVSYAAVANGHQLIAFLASRQDSVPPLQGRGLVFSSFEGMRAEFQSLWNNLSKDGVEEQALTQTLGDVVIVPPPPKPSSRIANYPGYWIRNRIQTGLETLGNLVLLDIVGAPELEDDFLARCYSSNQTLSEYSMVSREILEARYAALASEEDEATPVPARRGDDVSTDLKSDLMSASIARRPLILLGDVGVGKSMFIRHFRRIDAKEILSQSIVLSIDFGAEPALTSDLRDYVMERFVVQLAENGVDIEADKFVRNVYRAELQSFEGSVYGRLRNTNPQEYELRQIDLLGRKLAARDQHLQASLRYATRAQKRQVIVFLDNIDQRDFEFQELVFLIGQSLAQTWPATVFLSLRPETFYRSRSSGSLTAYQPRVFTISPPSLREVIDKRIDFCLELVEHPESRHQLMPTALDEQADRLAMYLQIVARSFKRRPELLEFVENLSGGNVREALGFLNTFVGSGHVDTLKIFEIEEKDGDYLIALHEFVRAIIYGDHIHYNAPASPIANVFDISTDDGRQHFLIPLLLAFVERSGAVGAQVGYVDVAQVMAFAQSLQFSPAQVEFALRYCTSKGLLQSPGDTDPRHRTYRITTVGAYTYKRLICTFVYIDAVVVDTPIVNAEFEAMLGEQRDVEDRLERARSLLSYLDAQWSAIADDGLPFSWGEARVLLDTDIERAARSAARWRSPDITRA